MKTRFEANVAAEVPKTRMSNEPGLPWKLSPEDLEKGKVGKDDYKAAMAGASPLKTRAVFPILLLVTIFVAITHFVSLVVTDSENTYTDAQKKEMTVSSMQSALGKINNEKNTLSENLGQMEKRVGELNAQKELFATVIESLTKKSDDETAQVNATAQTVGSTQ